MRERRPVAEKPGRSGAGGLEATAVAAAAAAAAEGRRECRSFRLGGANSEPEFILSISAWWSGKELGSSSSSAAFAVLTLHTAPLHRAIQSKRVERERERG